MRYNFAIMKTHQKGSAKIIIIVAVILLIGIGYFVYSKKNNQSPANSLPTETPTFTDTTSTGIIITSIKPNYLVKLPVTLEGYLDGKGWTANEGEIGIVEIFGSNGRSISNKEIIRTTTDWLIFPTYFKAVVGDRQMMSYVETDSGIVKITSNSQKDGKQPKSLSIPVRFK